VRARQLSEQNPSRLVTPETDVAAFTDHLSQAWGVLTGASTAQYLAWSVSAGVFSALCAGKTMAASDLCQTTVLNEDGVDSLLPILMALGLVTQEAGAYRLTTLAEEYFLPESPYYVGVGLFWGCDLPMPLAYLRCRESSEGMAKAFTPPEASLLLKIQLSRNLAPGVRAARSGQFEGIRHLVDIGGGAGAVAIPFALDHPEAKVTLVDLPPKLDGIREIVRSYGLEEQIELRAMDVFSDNWEFPSCDGMLFGNFFHVFPDPSCRLLSQRCFDTVVSGGKIFLHELLFDEGKAGPMIAALWNANMHVIGGRQRTAGEFRTMLHDAGFADVRITPTSGRFSLLEARKPS
jgi:hypothetical protein